jgi:diguanylate cyclase (GGDEF)-like protein
MLQEKNAWNLRSLDVSFSIARLLEDTLKTAEIVKRVCSEVPRLFDCVGCLLAMRDSNDTIKPIACWPDSFVPTGNQSSGIIYIKNLLESFPHGRGLIRNIHTDERSRSWTSTKVKSLCISPIHLRNELQGVLIAVGPPNETYEEVHANLLGIVASQTSMTLERATYFQQQEELARLDGLTGLFNHRVFQEMLREEVLRVRRYGNPLSLVMLDIDHFKKFNDTYGHQVGDEVIRMVAAIIKKLVRITDRACRYGGEEFTIILPETTLENSLILAERLRGQVEESRLIRNLSITISCGVVGFLPKDSPESFVKRADQSLYTAKESGRNRVIAG